MGLRSSRLRRPLFGYGLGTCVDRVYIREFLQQHRSHIRGHVLEIGDREYTLQYGGEYVLRSVVLHVDAAASEVDIVGDLVTGKGIPENTFDCIILTQTLPFLSDPLAALQTASAALRQNGVLLCTVPGISPISRFDADRWGDYWRFSPQGAKHLLVKVFGAENTEIAVYGNRISATALLNGWVAEELRPMEIEVRDPNFPVIIGCSGIKRAGSQNQ
jgi:hypothetical protein